MGVGTSVGVGSGVAVGIGVSVGTGVGVWVGCTTTVGTGTATAVGTGNGVGVGAGIGLGIGIEVGKAITGVAATGVGVLLATIPILAIPLALACLGILYLTKKAIIPLAVFLILAPILAWWPMDYPFSLAGYSLLIPLLGGISHYLSVKRLALAGSGVEADLPQS